VIFWMNVYFETPSVGRGGCGGSERGDGICWISFGNMSYSQTWKDETLRIIVHAEQSLLEFIQILT